MWNLNMDVKKKIGICFLMGMGLLAGICGAIKTSKLPETTRSDYTWATYDLTLWSGAETFLIVVCGCIPTLKPVSQQLFDRGSMSTGVVSSGQPKPSYRIRSLSSRIPINDDYTVILTELNKPFSTDLGVVHQIVAHSGMIRASNDSQTALNTSHSNSGPSAYSSEVPGWKFIDTHDMV
ncbi:hypothetical protein MMC14_010701 [Varicellaria rhodocarpa]|nr:hypothetical protein [Varicellaria rhodocarpa]